MIDNKDRVVEFSKFQGLKEEVKEVSIIGESQKIRRILTFIKKINQYETTKKLPVLIYGETGTGKEEIARYIYSHSDRANKKFVVVDCASIPSGLAESIFFGHTKGGFTGAQVAKVGKFEFANGGTIFLDEIGELEIETQKKLLRVVEGMEICKVGNNELNDNLDVRIICATNKDLEAEVEKGNFRRDLYYRLKNLFIELPPLRERGEIDFYLLCVYFLEKFRIEFPGVFFSDEAKEHMKSYNWPGNIRELKNVITRAVIESDGGEIKTSHLFSEKEAESLNHSSFFKEESMKSFSERMMKEFICYIFKSTGGNCTKTAKILKINRTYLPRLLKKHKIERKNMIF